MKKLVSKKYKVGDVVYLNTGSKEYRNKSYKILKLEGEKVILEGYKTAKKAVKISQENLENFINMPIWIHVSNIVGYDAKSKKPSRIGFKIDGEKKVRVLKKTGDKL